MSTVLWANSLIDSKAQSDQADKYALYKHLKKLDTISGALDLAPLSSICDHTDLRFNIEDIELPEGCASTNDVMAKEGVWIEAERAVEMLQKLLTFIRDKKTKFGLLKNDHEQVTVELEESISFAKSLLGKHAKFNFCVVQ